MAGILFRRDISRRVKNDNFQKNCTIHNHNNRRHNVTTVLGTLAF